MALLEMSPQISPRSFASPVTINGMGAANCNPWIWGLAGALALYLGPPIIGGFASGLKEGAKEGWRNRRVLRRKRR